LRLIGASAEEGRLAAAQALAGRLLQLHENEGFAWGEMALLFRSSIAFFAYENALQQADIPFVTVAGRGFYDRPEIRDLLRASTGINLALAFVPGAIGYDPIAPPDVDPDLASAIVWFDAFAMNVDRTPRNPNLLLAGGRLWLIDHGAAMYFHHAWTQSVKSSTSPFPAIRDHVLLPRATAIAAAGEKLAAALATAPVDDILAALPDDWLTGQDAPGDPAATRAAYADWLSGRLAAAPTFTAEAERARAALV